MLKSPQPLETQNVTLLRIGSSWCYPSYDKVVKMMDILIKKGNLLTETHTEGGAYGGHTASEREKP